MVNVVVKDKIGKDTQNSYPRLMRLKGDKSTIVLFISERGGTLLTKNHNYHAFGNFVVDWIPCTNNIWEKFEGELTLSND